MVDIEAAAVPLEKDQTLDTMLHQILNQALVAIDAPAGSVMLVANKQGILQIKARLGRPRPGRKSEPVYKIGEKSVASWVVTNEIAYLCPDVDRDPHFVPSRTGRTFRSLLSVPIIHNTKVIAVINADAEETGFFTAEHQARLERFAQQVAAPLGERIGVLDAISQIGMELSRLPTEGGVEEVLEKIARAAQSSLGADVVTVYQYVQERDDFPVEGTGPTWAGDLRDPAPMKRRVYPGDVPWIMVKERRSGFFSDARKETFLVSDVNRPNEAPRPRFVDREGICSTAALLLPFRAAEVMDEEVVGVMFANYRTPHDFNIDERAALATFADYAAAMILHARREEERRAKQMKLLESIAANFAHRMSNLAGPSRVAVQILRQRIDPADKLAHRQLDRIESEADILLGLAHRLADPFRNSGRLLDIGPLDLRTILEGELSRLSMDAGPIDLDVLIPPDLPQVMSVDFQLRQVFRDIFTNAVEAMSSMPSARLKLRAKHDPDIDMVVVEVTDSGRGIPDELRPRLFQPLAGAKQDKLGIGLWWCKTFMQATGGDVTLGSGPETHGATFVVSIPRHRGSNRGRPERGRALEPVDVLIVDDEPHWREQLGDCVRGIADCALLTASTYGEARSLIERHRFRLFVLDIRLVEADENNEDGLRLLTEIGTRGEDADVIVLTGRMDDDVIARQERVALSNDRCVGFVKKREFRFEQFQQLVQAALSRRSSASGQPAPSGV